MHNINRFFQSQIKTIQEEMHLQIEQQNFSGVQNKAAAAIKLQQAHANIYADTKKTPIELMRSLKK